MLFLEENRVKYIQFSDWLKKEIGGGFRALILFWLSDRQLCMVTSDWWPWWRQFESYDEYVWLVFCYLCILHADIQWSSTVLFNRGPCISWRFVCFPNECEYFVDAINDITLVFFIWQTRKSSDDLALNDHGLTLKWPWIALASRIYGDPDG